MEITSKAVILKDVSLIRSQSGNVLANLLVTIAIIGTLMATATPSFSGAIAKTKDVACKLDQRMVGLAFAMRSVDYQNSNISGWHDLVPLYIKEPVRCPHGKPWAWRNGKMQCRVMGK